MNFCNSRLCLDFLLLLSVLCLTNCHRKGKSHDHHKKKKAVKAHHHGHHKRKFSKNEDVSKKKTNDTAHKVNYFIRNAELPIYKNKMKMINDLGVKIHCKLQNCKQDGDKRYQIPDQIIRITTMKEEDAKERQRIPDQMNQFPLPREELPDMNSRENSEENKVMDDMQENEHHKGFSPSPNMFNDGPNSMPDMNDDESKFGQQSDAARFGQQPQMKISMPTKELQDMQPGGHSERQFNTGHDQGGGDEQGGGGMDMSQDNLMRMQHQQNEDIIQNSIQDKLGFMDRPFKAKHHEKHDNNNENSNEKNDDSQMEFAARNPDNNKDDMDGPPHGVANGESSAVSDKDIMNAEGIQPNEMHDLHNFLKSSNEVKSQHNDQDAEITDGKFVPPKENNNEREEHQHTNHHSKSEDEEQIDQSSQKYGKPHVKINPHASVENHEMNLHHSNSMFKPGAPNVVPSMGNLLGGMGENPMFIPERGPPNIDYVQQNARQMLDSNSDYRLPGSTFTNLWKDFMLTTQSQLGGADPSANSREGLLGGVGKSSRENHRWKKSHLNHHFKL